MFNDLVRQRKMVMHHTRLINAASRVTVRICLLLIVFSCSDSHGAEPPLRLRVLTWNIHHGLGVDGKLDLARIANGILECRPDLVALQEVDQLATRSNSTDQPAELARLTGLQMAFGDNIPLQGGRYGNVILSRFPITTVRNHLLPNHRNGEQRGVLQASIAVTSQDRPILFLATHLDHRPNDSERIASAAFINGLVESAQTPALLAGDLNAVPDSAVLQRLNEAWKPAQQQPSLPTVPVDHPTRQIDYVLTGIRNDWKQVSAEVLPEALASDHRALLVTIEMAAP